MLVSQRQHRSRLEMPAARGDISCTCRIFLTGRGISAEHRHPTSVSHQCACATARPGDKYVPQPTCSGRYHGRCLLSHSISIVLLRWLSHALLHLRPLVLTQRAARVESPALLWSTSCSQALAAGARNLVALGHTFECTCPGGPPVGAARRPVPSDGHFSGDYGGRHYVGRGGSGGRGRRAHLTARAPSPVTPPPPRVKPGGGLDWPSDAYIRLGRSGGGGQLGALGIGEATPRR